MARVVVARHLFAFFPSLADREIEVEGATVAEVVQALDRVAPGFAGYVVDERGALRMHVNVFVREEAVIDRKRLSDPVAPGDTVYVFQALSGG